MESTQRGEIGQFGFTAMCPVLDMVSVAIARMRAAGKPATAIARVQRAAQRGWNTAGFPADIQRLALLVLDDGDDTGIAGEATGGFCGQRRPVFDLAAAGLASLQRFSGNVH